MSQVAAQTRAAGRDAVSRPMDETAVRSECYALRVIAGRGTHHAAACRELGQMRDAVVGSAQLEGEHGLQVLALKQHLVAEPPREPGGFLEW